MNTMPQLITIVNAYGLTQLNTRIRIEMTPTRTAGTTGTRRTGDTDASFDANGSALSRPIANRIRTDMAWIARQQTKIATTTSHRNTLPQVLPSTSVVMLARPSDVGSWCALSLTAIASSRISMKPINPAVVSVFFIGCGDR